MNEMQQLSLTPDGTPEQAQAVGLHYEIVAAAQAAANSLLTLGRKLKQMRDTGGYKRLGFETFSDYTEQAVGIRQRQAYNYISVVENVPARLVEENAAAGVTKLALLGRMAPADQREVAGQDLANITVAELKKLVEERNGLSEQLSMIQDTSRPAAEAESYEVDMEALRAQALEQARAEVAAEHRKELAEQSHRLQQDHLEEDAAVLCFAVCADILGVQNYCKSIADLLEFFPVVQKAIESIGENLAAAIEIFRDGVFGDGDGHV